MINVEVSTIINRPIADVFAFASNFENNPQWETNFQDVKRTSSAIPPAQRMPSALRPPNTCVF